MAPLEAEIDRLYQLPLAEFTGARNALVRQAGKEGAAVRTLQKPQLAAWAVNQVYWRHRLRFDRLVKASEGLRRAHRQAIAGTGVDLPAAERAHREALADALDAARDVLHEAGEARSPAVLSAVTDTLRALPSPDPLGRLVRPLTPATGFEALAGVVPRAAGRAASAAPKAALTLRKGAATDAGSAKEIARVTAELARAAAHERDSDAAVRRLTRALQRAGETRERRQEALDAAVAEVRALTADLTRSRELLEAAAHERERLERRLAGLKR